MNFQNFFTKSVLLCVLCTGMYTTLVAGEWHRSPNSGLNRSETLLAASTGFTASVYQGVIQQWGWNFTGQLGRGSLTPWATGSVNNVFLNSDVIAVAAGDAFTIALTADGHVHGWGDNGSGQLANGTTTTPQLTPQVATLSSGTPLGNVTAVAAGVGHTLALRDDGTVWAWGLNFSGQLGDGSNTDKYNPVQVSGISNVVAISAGGYHSLALRDDGTVWAWGHNANGQLGLGGTTNSSVPQQVVLASGGMCAATPLENIVTVSAGGAYSVALAASGQVFAWGANTSGQVGNGSTVDALCAQSITGANNIVGIAAAKGVSGEHTLAVESNGSLWAWGYNTIGDLLGIGTGVVLQTTPAQVLGIDNVVSIAAGDHSIARRADGTVWCWGSNIYGQLGIGTVGGSSSSPVQVTMPFPSGSGFTAMASGHSFNLAVRYNGQVRAWGGNLNGELSQPVLPLPATNIYTTPVDAQYVTTTVTASTIHVYDDAIAVAGGHNHSLVLRANGTVSASGLNTFGQLGDNTTTNSGYGVQVQTLWGWSLQGIVAVAAAGSHSLALEANGRVWSWGRNHMGQLGTVGGNRSYAAIVQTSGGVPLDNVVAIAAGESHSLALRADGTVWAWGRNLSGQLGDGTAIDRTVAVQMLGAGGAGTLAHAKALCAGDSYSLVLLSDGTVVGCGRTNLGQLGFSGASQLVPIAVPAPRSKSITAGWNHSIALIADGTVWAWGRNNFGAIGDGTTMVNKPPTQSGFSAGNPLQDIAGISAGSRYSLVRNGRWSICGTGHNGWGTLGNGTTTDSSWYGCSPQLFGKQPVASEQPLSLPGSGVQDNLTVDVYPNPVGDVLHVRYHSAEEAVGTIVITDILGRSVYNAPIRLMPAANELQIPTEHLLGGMYTVSIHSRNARTTTTFMVAK